MTLEKLLFFPIVLASCHDYTLATEDLDVQPSDSALIDDTAVIVEEPCVHTDYFTITHPCLDVLAVVDTSGSMYDVTNNEIAGVQAFLASFTQDKLPTYPNSKMMVISAATPVDSYANNPIDGTSAASTIWNLDQASGTTEAPLEAFLAYATSSHASWMRGSCPLSVLFFSDEDDQSYNQFSFDNAGDASAISYFTEQFQSALNPNGTKQFYFTGTINPSGEYLCSILSEVNQIGSRFENLATSYSSPINDLCSSSDTWQTPALDIVPEVIGWELMYPPKPESIVVYIDGLLATSGCIYADGVVSYPYQENLEEGIEIRITYEVDTSTSDVCPE